MCNCLEVHQNTIEIPWKTYQCAIKDIPGANSGVIRLLFLLCLQSFFLLNKT